MEDWTNISSAATVAAARASKQHTVCWVCLVMPQETVPATSGFSKKIPLDLEEKTYENVAVYESIMNFGGKV